MYPTLHLEPSSTVERAAAEVRRAIFAGLLEPGDPLREVALSTSMGVGRSTIREALALLVADGVAVRAPHRGVFVKALSGADLADVARARLALETAGVRRWPAASEPARTAVRAALDAYAAMAAGRPDQAQLTRAHLAIHRALVGLNESDRLLSTADGYGGELRLGLAHLDRVRGNLAEQVAAHRRLVELLESGAVEAALAELHLHLDAAEVSLRAAIRHDRIGGEAQMDEFEADETEVEEPSHEELG